MECEERLRPAKRCEIPGRTPIYTSPLTGRVCYLCPAAEVKPWARDVVAWARDYERGILPREGGALAQAAWFLQAVRIALGAQARIERIRLDDERDAKPAPFGASITGGSNRARGMSAPPGRKRRSTGNLKPFER